MISKTIKISAKGMVLGCLLLASVGCTAKTQDQTKQQSYGQTQQGTNVNPLGTQNYTNDRVDVSDAAANKITEVPDVKSANVLLSRRNAYVAAVLKNNQAQLTREVEDQIAAKVREADPNIQNVYVSVNPEFVGRVNNYVNDVRQGRPIAGFFQEFTELVRRVFPTAH